jgi:small subunit ribosomal protein S9
MAPDKKTEQGEVDEPQASAAAGGRGDEGEARGSAAEDAVGAEEQPTERQLDREEAIADEPVAESEQRLAEATQPAAADSRAAMGSSEGEAAEEAEEVEAQEVQVEGDAVLTEEDLEEVIEERPRQKPEIPGADLEVDIVREGDEAYERSRWEDEGDEEAATEESEAEDLTQPIADASISLAAEARYRATGKRKTAVARVTLRPGTGAYTINGRTLEEFFPRATLQRTIRQPLETVGYETRIDVVATMHGGGVSAQAGALRHGVSRALIEAAPNLRTELKRRGFLTRDARVKERKKAGLKKARKRPQFSKR